MIIETSPMPVVVEARLKDFRNFINQLEPDISEKNLYKLFTFYMLLLDKIFFLNADDTYSVLTNVWPSDTILHKKQRVNIEVEATKVILEKLYPKIKEDLLSSSDERHEKFIPHVCRVIDIFSSSETNFNKLFYTKWYAMLKDHFDTFSTRLSSTFKKEVEELGDEVVIEFNVTPSCNLSYDTTYVNSIFNDSVKMVESLDKIMQSAHSSGHKIDINLSAERLIRENASGMVEEGKKRTKKVVRFYLDGSDTRAPVGAGVAEDKSKEFVSGEKNIEALKGSTVVVERKIVLLYEGLKKIVSQSDAISGMYDDPFGFIYDDIVERIAKVMLPVIVSNNQSMIEQDFKFTYPHLLSRSFLVKDIVRAIYENPALLEDRSQALAEEINKSIKEIRSTYTRADFENDASGNIDSFLKRYEKLSGKSECCIL